MSTTPTVLRSSIAALLIAAWLPQTVGLWPTPIAVTPEHVRQEFTHAVELTKGFPDSEETRAARKRFQRLVDDPSPVIWHVWLSWIELLALVLSGLLAAVMTWRAKKAWLWWVVGTSIGYYLLYSWTAAWVVVARTSSASQAVGMLKIFLKSPGMVYANFVVPLLLALALALSAAYIVQSRSVRDLTPHSKPTRATAARMVHCER